MVRNMSPENSNPKPEEARPLSRQERIEQLRQNEQQLELIIRQRDAVYKYLGGVDYDISVGVFVGPDGTVWGIKNRYGGMVSGDWLVARCASNESDKNRPKIKVEEQDISKVEKTERERYPFLPIGIEAVDTLHLAGGGPSFNIFWKKDKDSKGKGLVVAVADNRGIEFLPLDEIINPEMEKKIEEKIKAKKEADEFDRLVQPLKDEGLGEDVKIRGDLGASALSGATLSPASQTR